MTKATRLAVLCGLFVAILVGVGFVRTPSASAHALTANTSAHSVSPLLGSCEWFTESDTTGSYTTRAGSQYYTVWFDLQVLEERNWYTWAYCGYVATQVCITTDNHYPWGQMNVFNESYRDGNYIKYSNTYYNPINQAGTFCTYGSAYSVEHGGTATVVGYYSALVYGSPEWAGWDYCVGC